MKKSSLLILGLLTVMSFFFAYNCQATAPILYEYNEDQDDIGSYVGSDATNAKRWPAQAWSCTSTFAIGHVQIQMNGLIGDPDIVRLSITGLDINGDPNGTEYAYGLLDLTGAGDGWKEFEMVASTTLNTGTNYAIVLTASTSEANNYIRWNEHEANSVYANGHQHDWNTAWSSYANYDKTFRIYGWEASTSTPPEEEESTSTDPVLTTENAIIYTSMIIWIFMIIIIWLITFIIVVKA